MKARLIYNPTAGQELFKKNLASCLHQLESIGVETSTYQTQAKGEAQLEALRATSSKEYDIIIASGGDGTIKEVICGMAQKDSRPRLAIIPSGTVNDLAHALNLPFSIKNCTQLIANGNTKALDVLTADDDMFVNVAACGIFSEVSYEARSQMKTLLGRLAYYLKGIEYLPNIRYFPFQAQSSKGSFEGEALFIMIANSMHVGGYPLSINATPFDGEFDVTIVPKMTMNELVLLGRLLIQSQHLQHPKLIHFRTDALTLASSQNISLNLDGEFGGTLPKEFSVLPKHIDVFIP